MYTSPSVEPSSENQNYRGIEPGKMRKETARGRGRSNRDHPSVFCRHPQRATYRVALWRSVPPALHEPMARRPDFWPLFRGAGSQTTKTKNSIIMKIENIVSLKQLVPAALLLGALSLGLAPAAKAQLTFTVTEFTTDTMTITLTGGTLAGPTPTRAYALTIYDGNNPTNTTWVNNFTSATSWTPGVTLGGTTLTAIDARTNSDSTYGGNNVEYVYTSSFTAGATLSGPFSVTYSGTNLFNPGNIPSFALYWGTYDNGATLQGIAGSTAGSTSTGGAVPEPSTYAAIFGAVALIVTVYRRRRSVTPANV